MSPKQEEVPISRLVENAYASFSNTMLSTRAKMLLVGGFTDKEDAVRAFLTARNRIELLDRRKKLSPSDEDYLSLIEGYADDATTYVTWLRNEGGSPAYSEALVNYCTAFENCLKGIAIAFLIAGRSGASGFKTQVIVPGSELRFAREEVDHGWAAPRLKMFFKNRISGAAPLGAPYRLPHDVDDKVWSTCTEAFRLRNSIVHSLCRPSEQIEIGAEVFHPGWVAEVSFATLAVVRSSFEQVLRPFEVDALGIY